MIHVVARILATPGNGRALHAAFQNLLPQVHAEAGCVAYVPTIDVVTDIDRQEKVDRDSVTMIERWESLEHLKSHLNAPHMEAFRTQHGQLIASAELRVLREQ